ncbi:MAG: tetratricopeptide repeat protein [Bacteroidales bacterium]|nr:tetratricopeptide repeat protein [Bacteroidales bacterium]
MSRSLVLILSLVLLSLSAGAQVPDRGDVRRGNREFKKGQMQSAELSYRKGLGADTTSVHSAYNLASVLYRNEDYENAAKYLAQAARHVAEEPEKDRLDEAFKLQFNLGDAALGKKDYKAAVEAFMAALVLKPSDLEAKENYIYARKMLENQQQQQQQGDGDSQQNQDQNQDQNQQDQQNQDQQDQNQDNQNQDQQNQDQNQQPQPSEDEISPQQAEQILQAIRAEEEETQDKVKKEKAAVLKSRQKEKNW